MSELVNDGVGVDFAKPEEQMRDATILNTKKCEKGLDRNIEESDEYARYRVNAVEVTKNKSDCCETKKKPKEIPVVSEHDAGTGDDQTLRKCRMCHDSITKDIVTIREAKRTN